MKTAPKLEKKTEAKLDDFAHDLCVSGLGIVFLSVAGTAFFRSSAELRRAPRNDVPAPLSWTDAGATPIARRSPAVRPSVILASAPTSAAPAPVAPEQILIAGQSLGVESSTAQP